MKTYILASQSPRRRALLPLVGRDFEVVVPEIQETIDNRKSPEEAAIALARLKAKDVGKRHPNRLVLACDTVVSVDNQHLGKPENEDDARRMLELLSGKGHRVVTGCVFTKMDQEVAFYGDAEVFFHELTQEEIETYIATEEPFGKAGGYAVQGHAARHIERIEGDYYAIMGLPVAKVYRYLRAYERGLLFSGCNLR